MNPGVLVGLAAIGGLVLLSRSRRPPGGGRPAARPNPRRRSRKLSDSDRRQLEVAQEMSERFHGNKNHVLELGDGERRLPRYVVELGKMPEIEYEPERSERAGAIYEHEAGDRGLLRRKSKNKPLLAADPETRRPLIVPMRSPVKFSPERGLIG